MLPGNYSDYVKTRESGGNPFAKNPRSSATGPHQFITSTWMDLLRRRPDLGLTPDGRTDEAQSERAHNAFAEENAQKLSAAGQPVNNQTLYMAHHFGPAGALKLLSAGPNARIADVLPDVIKANPHLANKTVAEFDSKAGNTVNPYTTRPALSSAAHLGEGVLFPGAAEVAPDQGNGWSNSLIGAGAALSSINSPQQAAALNGLMKTAQAQQGGYTTHFDAKSGMGYRINSKTGRVESFRTGSGEQSEYDKANDREQAKQDVEMGTKIATDANSSRQALTQTQTLRQLLSAPGVYQGAGGEQVLALKKVGNAFGMNFEGVADADVARAMGNQLTLQLRQLAGGMPGSLSDKDLAFLQQANIGLDKSPEANQRLLDIYEQLHSRTIERDKLRAEYVAGNNGRFDSAGFNKMLGERWDAENKARDEAAKAAPTTPKARPPLSSIFK